ncbi:ABC transporter permease [Geomicrobium sp. JSM 1781026]|uniref:ABC transporter permease n=1 Tax=Geomicrobium sp. JSM 1781026 TaxID=3344580 RepID=UPI0035BF45EA
MVFSIFGVALKFFRKNTGIVLTSIISIALSVSLIMSMAVLSSSSQEAIVSEIEDLYGYMDLSVGYELHDGQYINADLLSQLTAHEEVVSYSPVLISDLYANDLRTHIYTIGVDNDDLVKSRYQFTESLEEDEMILNYSLANALGVNVGDVVEVENVHFNVVEIIPDFEFAGLVNDYVLLSRSSVKQLNLDNSNDSLEATYVLLELHEDAGTYEMVQQITDIEEDLRIDIAEEDPAMSENVSLLSQFILVLSFLVLIIASLFIIANFEVYLYKYKHQLAIMRAIGGSTKQTFIIIFLQSSLLNSAGVISGYVLSYLSYTLLSNWVGDIIRLELANESFNHLVALSYGAICGIIIQVFMLIPAYRSSRTLPLNIIQANEKQAIQRIHVRSKVIWLMFIGSIVIVLASSYISLDTGVLLGAILLLIAIHILFLMYVEKFLLRILPFIQAFISNASFVAIKNVIPQMRTNVFIIFIISMLFIVVIIGSSLYATIQQNEVRYLEQQHPTEIVITSRADEFSSIDRYELQRVGERMPTVSGFSTQSEDHVGTINHTIPMNYSMADIQSMQGQGILDIEDSTSNDQVIITSELADKNGIEVGDELLLSLYAENQPNISGELQVTSIMEEFPLFIRSFEVIVDGRSGLAEQHEPLFDRAFVSTNNIDETVQTLTELTDSYPELQINRLDRSVELAEEMLWQRWSLFIGATSIMLFSVLLGVFNTLINNIQSKRREFAILRTISLTPKGILIVILTQVILYISFGTGLGVLSGTAAMLIFSLIDSSGLTLSYQITLIMVFIVYVLALLVFIVYGKRLASRNILIEMQRYNK